MQPYCDIKEILNGIKFEWHLTMLYLFQNLASG
jgi:hypothetical protein